MYQRLAFAEQTRRPVEEHMKRPAAYLYLDLVALDAVEAVQERHRWELERDNQRRRG